MEKIKKIITAENLLSFFIIVCPLLDISSFLFRNKFETNYSISTILRPIIPGIIFVYIFFKEKLKDKFKIIGVCFIYLLYALIHLYIYKNNIVNCSYGTITHEAQYLLNYSFMILNLFIFIKTFNNQNYKKLQKSILISTAIYIVSIYISIITKTSSTTYVEGMGYKGWFESGNSISAILLLSTFIILSFIMQIQNKKMKICLFIVLGLIGIYLLTLIGTRVGLIGFILAILCFAMSEIFCKIIKKMKISKKNFILLISILVLLISIVLLAGSVTLQRRKHLKNMENTIIDESTGKVANITGDLTSTRNKIINNNLEQGFMSEAQQQSVIDLYNIAKKYNIPNTNIRMQQLIYHVMLIKNQKNILFMLAGNGYLINTDELVWEMEFPAILLNFGIIGFILFMIPMLSILLKSIIIFIKNIKKVDTEFTMLLLATILSFVLSTLSGYTFFNSSSMMIIIVANVLLKIKTQNIKRGE